MFLLVSVKIIDFHGDSYCFPIYISFYPIRFLVPRVSPPCLNFSIMVLVVLPFQPPTIMIKSIEFQFDSLHLSTIDHLDEKKSLNIFFNIYFNIIWHLTLYSWHWHLNILLHWHLWQRHFQLIRKLRGLIDKTLTFLVTEKLWF